MKTYTQNEVALKIAEAVTEALRPKLMIETAHHIAELMVYPVSYLVLSKNEGVFLLYFAELLEPFLAKSSDDDGFTENAWADYLYQNVAELSAQSYYFDFKPSVEDIYTLEGKLRRIADSKNNNLAIEREP